MENIVDTLRKLKELAINAANDTNTADDRATLQKEIVQRLDEINDIASHTNFNGKYLLNGDYGKRTTYNTSTVTTFGVMENYTTIDTQTEIETTTVVTNTEKITTNTVDGVAEPTELKKLSGNTITEDGVYDLAGYSGTLTISDSATNVKLKNSEGGSLYDVYIVDSGDNKKLWLDGLSIVNNTEDKSTIAFSGNNNALCLCAGTSNKISVAASTALIMPSDAVLTKATINGGKGLTITGNGSLEILQVSRVPNNVGIKGACIGSDYNGSCGNITINSGVTLNAYLRTNITGNKAICAVIGSGGNGSCGNITVCEGNTTFL